MTVAPVHVGAGPPVVDLATHRQRPAPWAPAALILGLLILGTWFRFYHLDRKVYGDDEVYTSLRIAGFTQAELKAERGFLDAEGWRRFQRVGTDRNFG